MLYCICGMSYDHYSRSPVLLVFISKRNFVLLACSYILIRRLILFAGSSISMFYWLVVVSCYIAIFYGMIEIILIQVHVLLVLFCCRVIVASLV